MEWFCDGIGFERGGGGDGGTLARGDGLSFLVGMVGGEPVVGLFGDVRAGIVRLPGGQTDTGAAGHWQTVRGGAAVFAAACNDRGSAVVGGNDVHTAVPGPGLGGVQGAGQAGWGLAAGGIVGVYVFEPGTDPPAVGGVCDPGGAGVAAAAVAVDTAGNRGGIFSPVKPLDVDVCAGDVAGHAGAGGSEHGEGWVDEAGLGEGN